jgi:nucleoid-associated protein YgaU
LGETLPLIAAQPEVYGDATLWPLLYRANRDQIRDPRHLWPGQVLRIPRTFSREDLTEARRFAQDKQLF